ncbi:hypothetical protein G5B40_03885 [Pikeienuella piscinae]|uniref:Uncharacterized protein n=1 Tax=Pikeienuella piscinae TaxID=2748098 RepID=A0A7L5BUX1_9RHOB|nr:hypothetical protein [Pikeienuella piscinae]QIE53956.1 hypothetical protein G5B40_03885 [Pikeienuella piscinae]
MVHLPDVGDRENHRLEYTSTGESIRPATVDSVTLVDPFSSHRPVWRRPNSLPCRQADGSNPCWDGDELFDQALAAGQTNLATLAKLRHDFAADRFTEGEICDGDVVSNSGARNGRAFYIPVEEVAFEERWLVSQNLEHRKLPDGRICIPSRSYGEWHYVFACGNAVQLLARPDAADQLRTAAAPVSAPLLASLGGFTSGFGGSTGGTGGTSAEVSPEEIPAGIIDVIANPPERPGPGGPDTPPGSPPPPSGGPSPTPPPAVVPVPPAILFMLTALGALASFRRRKPAGD